MGFFARLFGSMRSTKTKVRPREQPAPTAVA